MRLHIPSLLIALTIITFPPLEAGELPDNTALLNSHQEQNLAYEHRYPEIKYPLLRKAMDAGQVFLIDANSPTTYQNGHLPMAKSINHPDLLSQQLPILSGYPIVVYCGGPQCTAWHKAADFAAARGYTNIQHFKGGIKGWKEVGDSLSKGGQYP